MKVTWSDVPGRDIEWAEEQVKNLGKIKFAQEFNGLHDWEQTMIISSLQRIAQMMDAQNIDASPVLDLGKLDRYNLVDE